MNYFTKLLEPHWKVHRNLGVGLLENTYETALAYELKKLGLTVEQQVALPLIQRSDDRKCL